MKNRLLWLTALLLLTSCHKPAGQFYQGYVEGEWVYLSAPLAGYLEKLNVARGEHPAKGATAFTLSADQEVHGLQEAQARANAAVERTRNLTNPRRPQEIAALEAQLQAAEAALKLSTSQVKQNEALAAQSYVSIARLDESRAAKTRDAAQVEVLRQQLSSAQATLGRSAEVRSAEDELAAAHALVEQKRWQVDNKTVLIPASGEITELYYRAGEWVPAGQPVASLLPDDKRRIRFFVPETLLSGLKIGQAIEAHCDGCTSPIAATINFIAAQAEYTPPVIYSQGSREKLVFRVEATPSPQDAPRLHPGLPVEVRLK